MSRKKATREVDHVGPQRRKAKRRKTKTPEPVNALVVVQLLRDLDSHASRIDSAHSILLSVFRDRDSQLETGAVHSMLDSWVWPSIGGLKKDLTRLRKALDEPADDGKWNDIDDDEDDQLPRANGSR